MMVLGLTVKARGGGAFDVHSSIGDAGRIVVQTEGSGSLVRAHTAELYIGSHPTAHLRRGTMALPSMIIHGICKALGLAPNAAKMKRFQSTVERNLLAQLHQKMTA